MSRLARAAAMTLLVLSASAEVRAQACSDPPPDAQVRARLAALATRVEAEEPATRRWWTSFMLLHGTMATGAAILAGSAQDEGFRNEMLVGLASSALGFVSLVVLAPPMVGAGDGLRALPESTPEERLHKLRIAEGVFRRSAENIDLLRGWFPATLSSLYVTAAASTLLFAFERPSGAIIHSVGGVLLGLGRILLRPTDSRDTWRRYARAYPDATCDRAVVTARAPEPRVTVVSQGLGLGLRVDF
jgi:hypothetical protein